jgi:hypothetical protein
MRLLGFIGAVLLLASCLDTVDENAWKHRDGGSDADGQVVDLRLDGPASDSDGPVTDLTLPDGPPPVTECNDNQDNDGDGKTDYPDDPGCTSATDPSELGTAACDNGLDDDGDGTIDYSATGGDPGCSDPADPSENGSIACDDGQDNDGDGKTDYKVNAALTDPGCTGPSDTSENGTAQCDDGQDNDGDGKTDYKTDGTGDPDCTGPTDTSEAGGTGGLCASASWSQWTCKVTAAKCQGNCTLDGLPELVVACKPDGCTCARGLTVKTCSTPPGAQLCPDCEATFNSGCCNGM